MNIADVDLYHGAVLAHIVKFKAVELEKRKEAYGHYWMYTEHGVRRFLIKHTKGSKNSWRFTLTKENIETLAINLIETDLSKIDKSFLILVCQREAICILDRSQIRKAVDLNYPSQQWIAVTIPKKGAGMRVTGSKNDLSKIVKRNSFPTKLFK